MHDEHSAPLPPNTHAHTRLSIDGQATMADMCEAALAAGLTEIAFTEHHDLQPLDSGCDFYRPADYFAALHACRARFGPRGLTIRAGMEVGELHLYRAAVEPLLAAYPYDLVIGSYHYVGNEGIHELDYYTRRTPAEAMRVYFTGMAEMAQGGGFDVLGHLDIPKRYCVPIYGPFDTAAYEALIRPVWEACIANGIAPEINTSGLRCAARETLPGVLALRWYRDMGGERLTIGTDAHRAQDVAAGMGDAARVARAAGFTHVCRFERRRVVDWFALPG